jgi:flagellar motor switch protein FliN/FliY
MMSFLDCWIRVATDLFAQALAGEPSLEEALPRPLAQGVFGFAGTVSGDEQGRFAVVLDNAILASPLLGEGIDQKAGWGELVRETLDAAAGELLAKTGRQCRVERFEEAAALSQVTRTFQLKDGERSWQIMVRDEVKAPKPAAAQAAAPPDSSAARPLESTPSALSPGLELLLDVELEASLRFGCRELPLGEILELGPGDVVQLDRHVADPVDLIVGDKIVARGDVVLINGNFGLRITEVAAPRKRLESIRCLF